MKWVPVIVPSTRLEWVFGALYKLHTDGYVRHIFSIHGLYKSQVWQTVATTSNILTNYYNTQNMHGETEQLAYLNRVHWGEGCSEECESVCVEPYLRLLIWLSYHSTTSGVIIEWTKVKGTLVAVETFLEQSFNRRHAASIFYHYQYSD